MQWKPAGHCFHELAEANPKIPDTGIPRQRTQKQYEIILGILITRVHNTPSTGVIASTRSILSEDLTEFPESAWPLLYWGRLKNHGRWLQMPRWFQHGIPTGILFRLPSVHEAVSRKLSRPEEPSPMMMHITACPVRKAHPVDRKIAFEYEEEYETHSGYIHDCSRGTPAAVASLKVSGSRSKRTPL